MIYREEMLSKMIRNSIWLERTQLDSLHLENCRHSYEIFERVLVNVSASQGCKWQQLYHANQGDTYLFSELVVAAMIIKRGLMKHFEMNEEQVHDLMGERLVEILENHAILF